MQKEFGKHHKQNKTTAKSVGYGIANSITDKEVDQIEQLEAQALMIGELANSMQEQSQKHFKEMMKMVKATLNTNSPTPTRQWHCCGKDCGLYGSFCRFQCSE